jgi:hypothetical protein
MQRSGDSGEPRAGLDHDANGKSLHIQDCLVWAEIHYLDSPTDYREYLPQNRLQLGTERDDLVMLDASSRFSIAHGARVPLLVLAFVFILISGYLLWLIVGGR